MLLTNVCNKVYVLKLVIFVTTAAFTFTTVRAEADEKKETKKVDRIVTALKRNPRCESVILTSNNLSAVFWLHKGTIETSQPLWSSSSRSKLSKMIKNLKLNHKVMDLELPTQLQFENDPYKTSLVITRMTTDAINEFKWKGNLDCRAKGLGSKAQVILNWIGQLAPTAQAQSELGSGRRRTLTPPPALAASDEMTTAKNLAVALKKKNENGSCKSFLIESKNLTAVMWIENAQLVSGGYLWSKEARAKFKDEIKGVTVVKRSLKRSLPDAKKYAKDPIRSAQTLEKEFEDSFRMAKENQQFRCGISAIN